MKKFMRDGEIFVEELGKTVKMEDVKAEDRPGNSCLIFDCASEEILINAIKS